MKIYQLNEVKRLPISLEQGWEFFSNPKNLQELTQPSLELEFTSELPDEVYTGLIITYRMRPLWGIPINWVTEILTVEKPHLFVDEQRSGPYSLWHHKHMFREVEGGMEALDIIDYALPLGPLSGAAHALIVKKQLDEIFAYRAKALDEIFGSLEGG
ncbi:MAG: SRPBCC family protein [Thermodesulfobacteriota bacterium]